MIELRALGALLSYPSPELRSALQEIAGVLDASRLIPAACRGELHTLIDMLAEDELLAAQERYVALFDWGRGTCLNLFEHLHGESRDRGTAMVELKRLYERAGFELATAELPDYLPVVLEYLSCRDLAEARALLGDCAHLLRRIAMALVARRSPYAAVLQTLLAIAGERPVDPAAVPPREGPDEAALDRDWHERPAFDGEPLAGRG
ncbi:MAG: nitrate reductase molybdenum cofactor assembly chaperone, partial [Rhodospirillaceae bacterium]|nr:nitrate reductase molybdenum cofactor assembly chaperone [Rhodospirillaceae bacterium]